MKVYPLFFHDKVIMKVNNNREKPITATTCLLLDDTKRVLSVGFSLQNIQDGENRKTGNKWAKVRAVASLRAHKNLLKIARDTSWNWFFNTLGFFEYKAIFEPELSLIKRYEAFILKKKLSDKEAIEI